MEIGTKEKILNIAAELFYKNGFVNTGVEEIILACECKKPTLYYHFKSKSDLGLAYLDFKEVEFLKNLTRLSERSSNVFEFFASWTKLTLRGAKDKKFHGCPFTAFAAQMNFEDKAIFEKKLHSVKEKWLAKVSSILEEKTRSKKKRDNIDFQGLAVEAMVAYVGGSNLYRMTGQVDFISAMGKQFESIARKL